MSRFVILAHDWPFLHWDLMLESNAELLTWRLFQEPKANTAIEGEALAPHRLTYLNFEGEVSGNRGSVERWDHGELLNLEFTDNSVTGTIAGDRLSGRVSISQQDASTRVLVVFRSAV